MLEVRQPVEHPQQLTMTDVGPAEVEALRLAPDDANEVHLLDLAPRHIDRVPKAPIIAPSVKRFRYAHTSRKVERTQEAEHTNPEVTVQRMHRTILKWNIFRWRWNRCRSHHVFVDSNFWNGGWKWCWVRKMVPDSKVCVWISESTTSSG